MSTRASRSYPLVRVAFGASCISSAGVFVKYLAAVGVGATSIGAWRALIGAALLFPLARVWSKSLWPGTRATKVALLGGFFFAVDLFVWHRAILIIGVGVATILANTQIFWTALLARVVYGDPITRRFAGSALAAFVGVVLLLGVGSDVEFTPDYLAGVGFGVATGIAYACYVLSMQRAAIARSDSAGNSGPPFARAIRALAWASLSTGVILLAAAALEGSAMPPTSARAWLLLCGLALVPQVIGWLAITSGLQQVAAARGALVLLVQPTLATVWGVALFSEPLTPLQVGGAVVTLTAVYAGSRARQQPAPATRSPTDRER